MKIERKTDIDVMGIELTVGTRVIPIDSGYGFQNFREKRVYWKIVSFTPKMVKIERYNPVTNGNGINHKTIYSRYLMSIEPYFESFPEIFL